MSTSPEPVSLQDARKIVLAAQGLIKTSPFGTGPKSVISTIEHLRYVQIDTISVVERAHHHVFWSRNPAYKPEWLDNVQVRDRKVFEYWAHAAAYLPMEDYRYSIPVMDVFRSKKDRWPVSSKAEIKKVLQRVRDEGPLMSRDFDSDHKGGTWWDWKPPKWALQRLFLEGDLMVSHREGFQRVYDLPERIIPAHVDTSTPTEDEYYAYLILSTLKAQGIATRNGLIHLRRIDHVKFNQVLEGLLEEKKVISISTGPSKTMYTLPEYLGQRIRLQEKISILSPFDNTVIWRKRLKDLFDFDYTLECYLPQHKRTYGYFCLPVLYKDRFIGRVDVKAERKKGVLEVRKMYWDKPGEKKMLIGLLREALERFADFNACRKILYR